VPLSEKLIETLREEFDASRKPAPFQYGKTRLPLVEPSFGFDEACEALESLVSGYLTMGEKVRQFQQMFSDYLGVKHSVMVNSGSSANLVALSAITNPLFPDHLKPGDEVLTPAVTWATSVYPIIQCGLVPILVDVELETLNLSVEQLEKAITPKTRAILLVHLLGNPCPVDRILDLAKRHCLLVIEDACEAHGALINGRKVGSFGDLGTFSFFFSHHISTIEGGMICSSREDLAELSLALRTFGWIRDLRNRAELARQYSEIDERFLFVNIGYNLRPTEVQGGFGTRQLPKLEEFIRIRRDNADYLTRELKEFEEFLILPCERPGTRHVWFGYPVIVRQGAPFTRKEMQDFLEAHAVETRPVMCGNIAEQPVMQHFLYREAGSLSNSRLIMRNGFFFGNHHGIGSPQREAIAAYFRHFFKSKGLLSGAEGTSLR